MLPISFHKTPHRWPSRCGTVAGMPHRTRADCAHFVDPRDPALRHARPKPLREGLPYRSFNGFDGFLRNCREDPDFWEVFRSRMAIAPIRHELAPNFAAPAAYHRP